MMKITKCIKYLMMVIILSSAYLSLKGQDSLLTILQEELNREYREMQKEPLPPYYIEYRVSDVNVHLIRTAFGSLITSDQSRLRMVNIVVKVGDYSLDNTHVSQDQEDASAYNYNFSALLPVENNKTAIQQILWLHTNNAYLNALSVYNSIKENNKSKKKEEKKKLDDFSKEQASQYEEPPIQDIDFSHAIWGKRLQETSRLFLNDTAILSGDASLNYMVERKYFVSTEGTSLVQNVTYSQLQITSEIRNNEGNVIPMLKSYVAKNPEGFPSQEVIISDTRSMIEILQKLVSCPTAEPYSGPAILSSSAAGVFFHEIFGHRIEGHRLRDETDAHTFKEKVGMKVLPKTFQVYFDPQQKNYHGTDLIGYYQYDDEGIKSQKVNIVEDGILKTFLMSRMPVECLSQSNGHGRSQTGMQPVARQSNMFVESTNSLSDEALRKKLIKACKAKNLKYGYYFKSVYGGFTYTTRYMPNVFNIFPLEVYRIYVDDKPDELVRGVELIGTPLAMFEEIEAAGDKPDVFNGFCGAESGMIPVSTIAPAIFVNKVETQSQPKEYINLPILKMPGFAETKN